MESLAQGLGSLQLRDYTALNIAVPRYLYRVFDVKASGTTDEKWVQSLDAFSDDPDFEIPLSRRQDRKAAAILLNEHLRWSRTTSGKNYLVSWSNSLLFMIIYGIYRNKFADNNTPFNELSLCVVDTAKLPVGSFARDVDLMYEFADEVEPHERIYIRRKGRWRYERWGDFGL